MENEKFDFYTYGTRVAKDMYTNIKKLADEIGTKYGEQSKLEFESGIAASIPSYASYFSKEKDEQVKDNIVRTSK